MDFRSVVCGVDPSPAGLVAADRAARIVTPAGLLTLVGVDEIMVAGGAMGPGTVIVPHQGEAKKAVEAAADAVRDIHPSIRTVVLEGLPTRALLDAVEERVGDLIVVGTHETGRAAGIMLGSTATFALHDAPCSVLIAREGVRTGWPRSIVVGVDGSDQSHTAREAAASLSARFGAELRIVVGVDDVDADVLERLRQGVPGLEEHPRGGVDALVAASAGSDLVVVGSRGLKGLRALGSVSERVAHKAECSVLVARAGSRSTS